MAKRKKIIKRRGKGKRVSKLNPNKKKLREDFEIFAKGVERLEELRAELNKLDTREYEVEASAIKSKLKNVSYIPEIESEMRILKQKINGRVNSRTVRVENTGIKRKIKKLEEKVPDKEKIDRKIRALEGEIKKKRKISVKKQLNENEMRMVRAIPKLEGQLANFKKFMQEQETEERRKKELLKKIDPDVNLIVNDKFNLSLNEIKAELAKKLEDKETSVRKQLHDDLDARKSNFELQYKALEDRFEQKYKDKVNQSLHNEIKMRFNEVLKERLENEKKKLAKENYERLMEKKKELDEIEGKKLKELDERKRLVKKRLDVEFSRKLNRHEKELNDELIRLKKNLSLESEKKMKEEERRLEGILSAKKVQILDSKEKQLEKGFASKFAKIMGMKRDNIEKEKKLEENAKNLKKDDAERRKKFEEKVKDFEKKTEEKKAKLEERMKEKLKEKKNLLDKEKRKIFSRLEKSHEKVKQQFKKKKEEEMKLREAELQTKISKEEFEKLRDKLAGELKDKRENMEKDYRVKLDSEKDKLRKHFDEEILAKRFALNNVMHEKLTSEVAKLHQEHKEREQRSMNKIEEMKKNLENEKGFLSTLKNRFNLKLMKLKADEKGFMVELRQKLEREKQEAVKKVIKKQSEIMRKKLKQEFDEKLRLEIQSKQAEFEKRKADLALDVQKKAKQLFG